MVVRCPQRNVRKSVMYVQSCCFTDRNLLLFCHSCCGRRRSVLKLHIWDLGPVYMEVGDPRKVRLPA